MTNKSIDYLFVYFNARENRLDEGKNSPEEFFYGLQYFKRIGLNSKTIEYKYKFEKKSIFYYFLKIFQELIFFIFRFRYDFINIVNKQSFLQVNKSNHIIITNTRIGHSMIPYMIYSKLFNKKIKFSVFAMGMFNISSKYKIIKAIHKKFHKLLIILADNIIFIGQKEYFEVLETFPKYGSKIKFLPFGVDNVFWSGKATTTKDNILFIGNDSNRDFDFLIDLIKKMPENKFTVVSEKINSQVENLQNVELYQGSWNKNTYDDAFLKEIYDKSFISLIPLKDSLQPSGQSVALQSMSMMVPVIITKTVGFWDTDYFKHGENIYFINENESDQWIQAIDDLYKNEEKYSLIKNNAKKLIDEKFNCEYFGENLIKILEN